MSPAAHDSTSEPLSNSRNIVKADLFLKQRSGYGGAGLTYVTTQTFFMNATRTVLLFLKIESNFDKIYDIVNSEVYIHPSKIRVSKKTHN